MKLFHLYVDSDESESYKFDKLLLPFCRNKMGYGIFYWGVNNGEVIRIDSQNAIEPHSWFENSNKCVTNYDNDMGRWGKNKLIPVDDPKDIKMVIRLIFDNDDMLKTMKMWSRK